MKSFLWVVIFTLSLQSAEKPTSLSLHIDGQPLASLKAVQQVVTFMGFPYKITHFETDREHTDIELVLLGKKTYDPKRFAEKLKQLQVVIQTVKAEKQGWAFSLDTTQSILDLPEISEDSSAQMERSAHPYWFLVHRARFISIDAPYEGQWYPELAVFNESMEVLHSSKGKQIQERIEFELPEGSTYLKVSNSYGMKLMREGMWISASPNDP